MSGCVKHKITHEDCAGCVAWALELAKGVSDQLRKEVERWRQKAIEERLRYDAMTDQRNEAISLLGWVAERVGHEEEPGEVCTDGCHRCRIDALVDPFRTKALGTALVPKRGIEK